MDLELKENGEVSVLELSGKLTRGDGDDLLRRTVDQLIAERKRSIVVDLAKVPYMDSAGIAELIASYQRVADGGGSVKLVNPMKRVYDVLQLVKLDSVFEIFTNMETAIGSFHRIEGEA